MLMFEADHIERDLNERKDRPRYHLEGEILEVPASRGIGFKDLYANDLDLFEPAAGCFP